MKPEWGAKRTCQSCGAVFYDMRRVPIVCPKCGTQFDPEVFTKARRSRPQPVEEKKAPPKKPVEESLESEVVPGEDTEFEEAEEEGAEEEDVIEDASELGEDDPVVGKVGKVGEKADDEDRG